MSWFDKATAAAKLAASAAKSIAQGVDAELGREEWYKNTKSVVGEANTLIKEGAEEFGKTEIGTMVGDVARAGGKFMSNLPLIGLATDTARARHGVAELRVALQRDPSDPVAAIWLAEAIGRARCDLAIYSGIRSVSSPTYALIRQSMKMASQLGATVVDPMETQVLKLAFANSVRRLKRNKTDATAYDVLARVYLATGKYIQALRFAKLGILAEPDCILQWVTLARAYLACGRTFDGEKAARRAIKSGAGYGGEILAEITLSKPESLGWSCIEEYERIRSLVTPEHRRAYLGITMSVESVFATVMQRQCEKLSSLLV